MKQFSTVLAFELKGFFKNKSYVITTVLLVAVIAIVLFFPRIRGMFGGGAETEVTESPGILFEETMDSSLFGGGTEIMLVSSADEALARMTGEALAQAFPGYVVTLSQQGEDHMRSQIEQGQAAYGIFVNSPTDYIYYVDNLTMTDTNTRVVDEVMRQVYQMKVMEEHGVPQQTASEILNAFITHEEVSLGKDQSMNFFYTYVMIFVLYMVILLYGQMIATGVATEKSSRAMELLVTSAKPLSMMFGKVIASCIAGLVQILFVFGGAFLFYNMNKAYWGGSASAIIAMFFDIPPSLLVYMIVFFLLGFLFYAMLFGAIGSTVSKVEDVSTAITPAMILYLPGFFIAIFSMTGGGVDSTLTRIFSFLPFSSPFVMFTRIAMSTVPAWEIALCIGILALTVILIGILAAKIYRVGVLLYGTKPKLFSLVRSVLSA